MLSTNFELNEPVGIQGRAYRVADFHYFGLDADPIVEFRRLTDGTALFLASDRIWDMALRNKIPSFRQKRVKTIRRYRAKRSCASTLKSH